jgi:hypothetical protein
VPVGADAAHPLSATSTTAATMTGESLISGR